MTPLPTSYPPVSVPHEILLPVTDPQTVVRSPPDSDSTEKPLPGPTTILFQLPMNSEISCKVFWLGFDGVKTIYNELRGAGAQYEQSTTVG